MTTTTIVPHPAALLQGCYSCSLLSSWAGWGEVLREQGTIIPKASYSQATCPLLDSPWGGLHALGWDLELIDDLAEEVAINL